MKYIFLLFSVLSLTFFAGCVSENPEALEAQTPDPDFCDYNDCEYFEREATWDRQEELADQAMKEYYDEFDRMAEEGLRDIQESTYYVSVSIANVRECANLNCHVVYKLTNGEEVFVLGRSDTSPEWFEVWIDNSSYYMHESVLAKNRVAPVKTQEPIKEASTCPNGCTFKPDGCDIKGNVSFDTGEKIYHLPGDEFYNQTVINTDYGERWFCTPEEAEANGWRRTYH